MKLIDEYIKTLEKELKNRPKVSTEETGIVSQVKDGVVILEGLDQVAYGELIEFQKNVLGYVIDLTEDEVGAIILGDYTGIKAGDKAKALGYTLSVPVSEALLGRVVDPLGLPLDGKAPIKSKTLYPVEKIAAGVVKRHQVNVPLQTGIKAIDALIPIGRGQRELIIGDRGTGKTTIAIDTILNQKGQDVICVYCAVGQKNSKVAEIIELLRKNKADEYTVVVNASASDSAATQYLAPYSASAIAEYFMDKGKDVLVVYDDLTKHAWAYRQVSLILRRPAGREAYPGDVFYLHSRLLERACRIDEKYGGGSITALPIIETLDGDLSAYIPTNVISITDGQISLETDLFNSGIRPAVNVGLSVSRVGGTAQTKAMKSVAGKLKLDLAQYRDLAAFSQFESELDEETKKFLNRGAKVTQILKQRKHRPMSLAEQVAIIWAASNAYLDQVPVGDIEGFETKLIETLRLKGKKWLEKINKNKIMDKKDGEDLEKIIKEIN
jgi:F-type H+-transporting ATPase subunit alpha